MFQIYAYEHVRLEMEQVRRRAERLSRHRTPSRRDPERRRTRRRARTRRP